MFSRATNIALSVRDRVSLTYTPWGFWVAFWKSGSLALTHTAGLSAPTMRSAKGDSPPSAASGPADSATSAS